MVVAFGPMDALTDPLIASPLLIPVDTIPVLYQGHGPACAWYRHTQIDSLFAISTIGRCLARGVLPRPFETRAFLIREACYVAIAGVVYSPTQFAASRIHRCLVQSTVTMIQTRPLRTPVQVPNALAPLFV